jgi:hypothetical protein
MKKLLLLLSVVVAGCGGGGSGSATNTTQSPAQSIAVSTLTAEQIACSNSVPSHIYGDITYPSSYNGNFPIPKPNQTLPANVIRSVGFKDYWPGFAGTPVNSPCKNTILYARNTYIETLNRLQLLGANQVWIYNYGAWDDINKDVWTMNSNWQIPESEVIFIVQEAAKRNIKVYQHWQFASYDMLGNHVPNYGAYGAAPSPEWDSLVIKIMNSWHNVIKQQAIFAEKIGIAGISADWQAFYIPNLQTQCSPSTGCVQGKYREYYLNQISTIIDDIRTVYHGKIVYGANNGWILNPTVLSKIDALILDVCNYNINTDDDYYNFSVPYLKNKMSSWINSQIEYGDVKFIKNSKVPVIWQVGLVLSKDMSPGSDRSWSEDGFCVNNCIQLNYKPDFSIQAVTIEAQLEVVKEQTFFTTQTVNVENYWHTDDITNTYWGGTVQYEFPNLSPSIRNKPAEAIVKYWFGRG